MFIFIIKEDPKCFRPYPPLPFFHPQLLRNGPLENLLGGRGGGGWGRSTKKYWRKGKLNEKKSCTPINPKKYSCFGLKKFIQGI